MSSHFATKSFRRIIKLIRGKVIKLFCCIPKLKTAPKIAGLHLIFEDYFSKMVIKIFWSLTFRQSMTNQLPTCESVR